MSRQPYQASINAAAAKAIARKVELRGGLTYLTPEQQAGPDIVRVVADELGRQGFTEHEGREMMARCIPSEPAVWPPRIMSAPVWPYDGAL